MPPERGAIRAEDGIRANIGASEMLTDNTCNGWRNAATWTVNLWFGDSFAQSPEDGISVTAEHCRETVESYVEEFIGHDSIGSGFIWDMLDLNSVDWDGLASHHEPETDWIDA